MHSIRLNVPSVTLLGQLPTLTDIGLLRCTDALQIRRRFIFDQSETPFPPQELLILGPPF